MNLLDIKKNFVSQKQFLQKNKSVLNIVTFSLKDYDKCRVDFKGETLTVTSTIFKM